MIQVTTGIQTTGTPHLGNIAGAMQPAIAAGDASIKPPVYIVADMHSMLSVRDPDRRREHVLDVASAWIAVGAGDGALLYRQSRIEELGQIAILLSGTTLTTSVMQGSLKPGVFASIHPLLMAADLLMCNTTHVPVGPDSAAHIEIAIDVAHRFNSTYGEVLTIPVPDIRERPVVPGTDGLKMSKSRDNTIDVLAPPEQIREALDRIPGPISLDAAGPYESPPPIATQMLSALGRPDIADAGMTGPQVRAALLDHLVETYRAPRAEFLRLRSDPGEVRRRLGWGEEAVRDVAIDTLDRMRDAMGMGPD